MNRRPPQSPRTYTLFPYTTLFRSNATEEQIVTDSSRARQERGGELVAAPAASRDPLAVLWDGARPALPIYRLQPDDPDGENTLATAVFEIATDKVAWRVYDRRGAPARFAAEQGLARSVARRVGKECVSTCRSRCAPYT